MLVTVVGKIIDSSEVQPQKAETPMEVSPSVTVTEVKLAQFMNADMPIWVTELGIATSVNPLHA